MCFNCLKPARHQAKFCSAKGTCDVDGCKTKHSSLLHLGFLELKKIRARENESPTQDENVSTGANDKAVTAHSRRITEKTHVKTALPIVTVTVTASSGRSVETHALLDTGGDRTFCSKNLLNAFRLKVKRLNLPCQH